MPRSSGTHEDKKMATTTLGVKLDDPTRERLKAAATSIDRTPHWLIKQAIFNYLEKLEGGATLTELNGSGSKDAEEAGEVQTDHAHQCFLEFAESILPQSVLRASITAAYRRPEPEVVPMLIEQARLPAAMAEATNKLASSIAEKLRNQKSAGGRAGIVQGLLQEFSLSSQEGVALMCLAEALLRIPDKGTRDALIRDKISTGNWQPHLGNSPSLFVNAATWGLLLTGKLVATHNETGLTSSLSRIIGKSGEPMIRKGVDMAMRLMGEQFVTGETIAEALANASKFEAKGFRYSYDMLGEAALTEHDAQKYLASYDMFITNDPYGGGGTHLSDVSMIMPVFHKERLIAWTANKAHWTEVGGKDPGSFSSDASEIYQEGLQFPTVRIYDRGRINQAVVDIIAANVRLPDMTLGDLHACAAALRVGE